jgi:heat shock protein HslJ
MNNRARWAGLAALLAALTVAGCSSGEAATQPPNLNGTTWRVVEIAGEPTIGGNPPTLTFRNGRIRGDSGCNTFSADVSLDQTTIDVGEINSTLRLCDGDVGATETQFMRALIGASALSFDEKGHLLLAGAGGDVQFVASR